MCKNMHKKKLNSKKILVKVFSKKTEKFQISVWKKRQILMIQTFQMGKKILPAVKEFWKKILKK